jgi:hypothetical protein
LTSGQIKNWSNPKLVKFDHWSNSQVVKPAQFGDLAIFTKWSNSTLVKIDIFYDSMLCRIASSTDSRCHTCRNSLVLTPPPRGGDPAGVGSCGQNLAKSKISKLTTRDPDRLLSTCRAGFRVFGMRPMRSPTQIYDPRPLREKLPKGLGDFPESHLRRKSHKLTVWHPDRLLSTCRAGCRVFRMRPMRSPTQIYDPRPL